MPSLPNDLALREFRHRVSNDLALLAAVINRRRATHPRRTASAAEALDDAAAALVSLSLLYRCMYDPDPDAPADVQVEIATHLSVVTNHLRRAYLADLGIGLTLDVDEALIPAETARILALIICELVANAARHAFPARAGRIGRVIVVLRRAAPLWFCAVRDDGIGLPEDIMRDPPSRGGLSLVAQLATGLNGALVLAALAKGGTAATVSFPDPTQGLSSFLLAAGDAPSSLGSLDAR